MNDFSNDKQMKSEMAYWTKCFALMKEADFDNLDTSNFTVIQRIAFNYVEQSKTDTKTAEKIIKLVQWYDTGIEFCL